MIKKIILIVVATISTGVFSDKKISTIDIEGLKRTRKSVITELLGVDEGDEFSKFNEDEFSQRVLKTGVLQKPVITTIEDGEMIALKVDVKDKWTLIPAPMVTVSEEEQSYGVLFYESNFLGLRKSLFTSLNYSTKDGISGDISYQENNLIPGILKGRIGIGFSSSSDNTYFDFVGEDLGEYSVTNFYSAGSLYYTLNDKNILGLKEIFKYYNLDDVTAKPIDNLNISQYFNTAFLLTGDYQRYSSTINTGLYYLTSYTLAIEATQGEVSGNYCLEAKYTHNLFSNLFLRGGGSLSLLDKPFLLEDYWGSESYSRTIPAIKHDRHFAGAAEFEHEVLKFSFASFSYLLHFEAGLFNRNSSDWQLYYGPAAGIRMYFPWLSVPAMGIDMGYNLVNSSPNFSFTIAIQ